MAKHVCVNCKAEVGLLQQVKMSDGIYVCRKCAAKTHPLFEPVNDKNLPMFESHKKQLEEGKLLYEKLFLPRLKPADKSQKLKKFSGGIEVAKDIGLIAFMRKRGQFFIWGGTPYHMVFRLGDLFRYDYAPEKTKGSDGKTKIRHYINFAFWDTLGYDSFTVEVMTESAYIGAAKYFNECFGIQRDLKNIATTWKNQIADIKMATQGVKTLFSGNADGNAKQEAAEQLTQAAKNQLYGDRTELLAKADTAIKSVING